MSQLIIYVKHPALVKISGTLAGYELDDAYRRSTGNYNSSVFRGRIGIDISMKDSQEHVEFAAKYVGISGRAHIMCLKLF